MGLAIDQERFEASDYTRFSDRLSECLAVLGELLERRGFGAGESSLGAELELSLVDAAGQPALVNTEVLDGTADPRMTIELDRFNLECNLRHGPLAGTPFTALEREIDDALVEVRRAARAHGARPVAIGILPTLRPSHLGRAAMTDVPRFRALAAGIQRLRREPFRLNIDGEDPLHITCNEMTYEGAATSLQVHLRVEQEHFARIYNAIQMATAPALAVSGNSPTFLGHRLWEETRVALFKQAVDDRGNAARRERRVARVSFGTGWVLDGVLELFSEAVSLHEPLLPVLSDEDPRQQIERGATPRLEEIRLHQGTVWRWNRAIYDPTGGGHLRIEMRSLPAGPTAVDMVANMAFHVGLALGLAPEMEHWVARLPFECVHSNFYRAAQRGLDAELIWAAGPDDTPTPVRASTLVQDMLPIARDGLVAAGVSVDESERLLGIIDARCKQGLTGARWQRNTLAALERDHDRDSALASMLERYIEHAATGEPVHAWSPEG